MAFLAYPAVALTEENPLLYLVLAAFALGYTRVIWRNTPHLHANRAPVTIVATLAAGTLLLPVLDYDWLSGMGFYSSVLLLINFPLRWWRVIVVAHTAVFVFVAVAILHAETNSVVTLALLTLIVSSVQVAIYKQIDTSMQLQQARAELTQLAIAEERLRIARDLHDILGQRLSAVALKAEVAARIIGRDPDRAITEMNEVGAVARDALAEVRAAVSGYRHVSLAVEAESAEALLKAAGVVVTVSGQLDDLREPVEECAAWLVREAATNVVRHAKARRCDIVVSRGSHLTVEVRDDGIGAALTEPPPRGTGLTGLAERVALAGGELWVGPCEGWFLIRARLPRTPADARPRVHQAADAAR
jgi:two-component system sensor histidine kinase DesK